jgi:hypothetical protein
MACIHFYCFSRVEVTAAVESQLSLLSKCRHCHVLCCHRGQAGIDQLLKSHGISADRSNFLLSFRQ